MPRPADCNFDERYADRAINFFERYLRHPSDAGEFAGRPFIPAPFQAHDLREVFGRVDESGNREIRQVIEFIPKKNGKSAKAAGIVNKLLYADDEAGAHIYGAAADRSQAEIVFKSVRDQVLAHPELRLMSRVIDNFNYKEIRVPLWNSFYQVLSKVAGSKHGLKPSGIVVDELHAFTSRELWDNLTGGATISRDQPLTWAISTVGVEGESPVAEELWGDADQILRGIVPCPKHLYVLIYAAPEKADPGDRAVWRFANPALGHFLREERLEELYSDALRRGPAELARFKQMHLNIWKNAAVPWITVDEWDECDGDVNIRELAGKPCYLGIDLSSHRDLTAVVCVWRTESKWIWAPWYFLPAESIKTDRAHSAYPEWVADGKLITTPGARLDYEEIRRHVNHLRDDLGLNIQQVGYDPHFAGQLAQQLQADRFEVIECRQTFATFTEPCLELEAAVAQREFGYTDNPILRWNVDCVRVRFGPNGVMRPDKPDRIKTKKRIDGFVAGLMAMHCAIRDAGTYRGAPGIGIIGGRS